MNFTICYASPKTDQKARVSVRNTTMFRSFLGPVSAYLHSKMAFSRAVPGDRDQVRCLERRAARYADHVWVICHFTNYEALCCLFLVGIAYLKKAVE